ncbi:MAG: hybrid sensor histidine kinase/response regulator [Candidatus Eisenbacteria bacterium]|uniref:histidine kinase n=1 Tax=Eiseniibacteriota bacterium TaxID=2212470 RepID=A0A849SSR4_UNCEI|nr:hybrid sensor histidine kinase/response regulator [Candidatus Eisenbacteria bacterium]
MHRVLAVDDNSRNLAIVEKTLDGAFQLVTASSGEQALEIAPCFRPDLILLDIMMPGIDGYETCRRLRALPAVAAAKIIMVSARATTSDRLEGYAAGANDYVTKPFDSDELLAKLHVYLRLKSIEEIDQLKSDLLGLLSHETATPLTTILGPASILLEDPSLSPDHREFVKMIHHGGVRLQALVEKVAYLSQLKAGFIPREAQTLDAEVLANQVLKNSRRKTLREDVAVEVVMNATVRLEGDPQQLGVALGAVLDNALRLSPAGGVVRLELVETGPWSGFSVSDRGPGIGPEFIDFVFNEFVVEHLKHHSTGHGLSLATARVIVEQHGGSLTVESAPGHGATFRMLLPTNNARAIAA